MGVLCKRRHFNALYIGTEPTGLVFHGAYQLPAGNRLHKTGIILHFIGVHHLASGRKLLDDKKIETGAHAIYRSRQSRGAGADYYKVFHNGAPDAAGYMPFNSTNLRTSSGSNCVAAASVSRRIASLSDIAAR